jgi:hypothetical protein
MRRSYRRPPTGLSRVRRRLAAVRRSLSAPSVVLLLVLFGTACASSGVPGQTGGTVSPTTSGPTSAPPPSASATAAVPEILDFRAPLVGGGMFDGGELAGAPVAIWFWAPW